MIYVLALVTCLNLILLPKSYANGSIKTGDPIVGAQTWANNCVRCHNLRAAESLRDDQWITTMFHMRIRGQLTGKEARDVLAFLQSSNSTISDVPASPKKSSATAEVKQQSGKALYNQTCLACHGSNGKGVITGMPDFTSASGPLTKSDSELIHSILNGRRSKGAPIAMPPKGGNPSLTASQIKSVLKYIKDTFK